MTVSAPSASEPPPADEPPGCLPTMVALVAAGLTGWFVLGMVVAGAFGIAAGTGNTDAESGGTIMNAGFVLGAVLGLAAAYRVFRGLIRR